MKKAIFLFLMFVSVYLWGYSAEDLESAIKESDEVSAEKIVKDIRLSENDKQRLLALAQDIVEQRKTKYQSHFVKPESSSIIFEYSTQKLYVLCGGLGLLLGGFGFDIILNTIFYTHEHHSDFAPIFTTLGLIGFAATNVAVHMKHLFDIKKLYDHAINIKQLVYKCDCSK